MEEIKKFENKQRDANEIAYDAIFKYSDSGLVKIKIETAIMKTYTYPTSYIEMDGGVEVTFYDEQMKENSYLTADHVLKYNDKKEIEFKDNIMVINLEGDTMWTEYMIWKENKKRVYSDKFVKIRRPKETIFAKGFETDSKFSNYTFYDFKGSISNE